MATSTENKALILTNKKDLYGVEAKVFRNKQALYEERADIETNHDLIWRNYHSAFQGNRQMANLNTDGIFKNRRELLAAMVITDCPIQANYRASHMNKQKIEYLDNRSKLNEKVANVNATMTGINAELIEINKAIMCANAMIVAFNTEQLEKNSKWLNEAGALEAVMKAATPDDNKAKIAANASRINEIADRARANNKAIHEGLEGKIQANKDLIKANKDKIEEHRLKIKDNANTIRENQKLILEKIYGNVESKYEKK